MIIYVSEGYLFFKYSLFFLGGGREGDSVPNDLVLNDQEDI